MLVGHPMNPYWQVEELNQYREGIDQEIQQLAQSLQVLKTARDRFNDSKTCIEHLKTYEEGMQH